MFIKIDTWNNLTLISQHHPGKEEDEGVHKTCPQKLKATCKLNLYLDIPRGQ